MVFSITVLGWYSNTFSKTTIINELYKYEIDTSSSNLIKSSLGLSQKYKKGSEWLERDFCLENIIKNTTLKENMDPGIVDIQTSKKKHQNDIAVQYQ